MIDVSLESFVIEAMLTEESELPARRIVEGVPPGCPLVNAYMKDDYLVLQFDDGKPEIRDVDVVFQDITHDDIRIDIDRNLALDMTIMDISLWKDGQLVVSRTEQRPGVDLPRSELDEMKVILRKRLHETRKREGLY